MALTLLKDESELQSYVTSNPSSYIVVKGYYYVGLDPTTVQQYKNVLTGANQDTLKVLTPMAWATIGDMEFKLSFTLNTLGSVGVTNILFARGSSTSNRIELTIQSTNELVLRVVSNSVTLIIKAIPTKLVAGVDSVVEYIGSKLYLNGVEELDDTGISGSAIAISGTGDVYLNTRGYNPLTGLNISYYDFSISNEAFSLNEPSGALFTGSLGTTGTRETSSLDPDYINDVMIQPYNP